MNIYFNIDKELVALFLKHNIFKYDKEDILDIMDYKCNYCDKQETTCASEKRISSLINELFEKIPDSSKVAVRGIGADTMEMLKILKLHNKDKITYLVDIRNADEANDIPVLSLNEIQNKVIDLFIIPSHLYRHEIKSDLINRGYNKNIIIDIHEYLMVNGINIDLPFRLSYPCRCRQTTNDKSYNICWRDLNDARRRYESALCLDDNVIQIFLYELILHYLYIRDFVNAKKYMNIYIANRYIDFIMFEDLLTDLDKLFAKMKNSLSEKNNENIIIFLFDGLENDFIERMSYMKTLKEKSIAFENSFTQYYYTTSTIQTMFTGKDLIDEKAYEVTSFTCENSKLLRILKENAYKPYILRPKYHIFFEEIDEFNETPSGAMPKMLWNLLQALLTNNEKGFYYTHFMETHLPHACGYSNIFYNYYTTYDLTENERSLLLLNSLKYVDEQFEFYNSFIPNNNAKIIMSDHGFALSKLNNTPLQDHKIYNGLKTVLFVHGDQYEPKIHDGLFSLNNFSNLISHLIGAHDDLDSLSQDYSKIQLLPYYDKESMDFYLQRKWSLPLPKKGILTKTENYTIDYKGQECYLVLSNDNLYKNRIHEPEYIDRINELRKLCGNDFNGIFEHPKFAYAKEVYTEKGYI